jgi:vitamin-K-epoxide reductase (warfarin-sensitive)
VQFAVTESASPSSSTGGNRLLYFAIACLAVLGMIVSAISLQRHYAKSETRFCDVGEKFNCDIVNRSEYSSLGGIPVAGIGVVGYAVLFALATIYRSRPQTQVRLLAASAAGLAFALYLTYIEGYVLDTWCILCLTSLGTIAGITVLAGIAKAKS